MRRLSQAFQVPGSGDADIKFDLTGNATFSIRDVYGNTYLETGPVGTFFNYRSTASATANTTLNGGSTHNLGDYVACNSNAGAFTITLPTYTERLQTGSWIGFYDRAGTAKEKVVSINPDTANTTYTINGSSASQSLLDTNYGSAILFYVATTTNWILLRSAGASDPTSFGTTASVVNTNHTIAEPERTILVTTGSSNRTITLPDAVDYVADLVHIVKIDTGTGNVVITPAVGDTINGAATLTLVGQYRAATLVSDGSDWYILSERAATARFTTAVSANYTVAEPINVVLVTTAANAVTVELPVVTAGYYYNSTISVKKVDSGAGAVTVNTADSATIDGAASVSFSHQYESMTFATDGTNWHVVSDYGITDLNATAVQNSAYTAKSGDLVVCDTSGGAFTVTLPASPTADTRVGVFLKTGTSILTIDRNSTNIDGAAANQFLTASGSYLEFQYAGSQWCIVTRKFNDRGTSILGSTYSITADDSWESTGLSVSLPSAGTYRVWAEMRGLVWITAGSNAYIVGRFYDNTAGAVVANSERFNVLVNTTGIIAQLTAPMSSFITVTAASEIRLQALRSGTGPPTWSLSQVVSNNTGGWTAMSYERVA